MAPDFLVVVLHGFLHGIGFMFAVLCFGHPWIAIVIVLAVFALRRRGYHGVLTLAGSSWRGSRRRNLFKLFTMSRWAARLAGFFRS